MAPSPIGQKFSPTKNPETVWRVSGSGLFQEIQRTLPASTILLVAALLRGVSTRVGRGGILVELGKCVEHDLQSTQRIPRKNLTTPPSSSAYRLLIL
jgi:hypothetical protein